MFSTGSCPEVMEVFFGQTPQHPQDDLCFSPVVTNLQTATCHIETHTTDNASPRSLRKGVPLLLRD
eukprot:11596247-Prorocentrum_lima.AAC.1